MYHAILPFLNKGLKNLAAYCAKNNVESVSVPKTGAGLGKLDWEEEVKLLMLKYFSKSQTMFRIYENFKNEYEK